MRPPAELRGRSPERQEMAHEDCTLVGIGGVLGGDNGSRLLLVGRAQLPAFVPRKQLLPGPVPTGMLPTPRELSIRRRMDQPNGRSERLLQSELLDC
jgi:hypothetical protein